MERKALSSLSILAYRKQENSMRKIKLISLTALSLVVIYCTQLKSYGAYNQTIVKDYSLDYTSRGQSYTNQFIIAYGDSYSFNSTTGKYTLYNVENMFINGYRLTTDSKRAEYEATLKGKYAFIRGINYIGNSEFDEVIDMYNNTASAIVVVENVEYRGGLYLTLSLTGEVHTSQYVANKYNLSYKYDGEQPKNAPNIESSQQVSENTQISLKNTPVLSGYTFDGWRLEGTSSKVLSPYTMPNRNISLVGSFKANEDTKYTVNLYKFDIKEAQYK